ncbi:MAG: hypothetical protein KAI47_24405, partial [Deltaproteobacteria bacterium]|nr:hypothetical protein [Deltaproteobacteria bacterium]
MPFFITEGEPYRPEAFLWIELPRGQVVAYVLVDPHEAPLSFGQTLVDAMASPFVGPPRRPTHLRVANPELAAELKRVAPTIPARVAPTPEIDHFVQHLAETMPEEDRIEESYLAEGKISPEEVEELFVAAKRLYELAPWEVAQDHHVMRLDIPELGIEGACLSIIGHLGDSLGFLIFPSIEAYDRFVAAAISPSGEGTPHDLGTSWLVLNFEKARDLPAKMRREAATYRWPVASTKAYPRVDHREKDGFLRPLSERDVAVATHCATFLASFFVSHRDLFIDITKPICETYSGDDDIEVRFTAPYEAGDLFEVNQGAAPAKEARAKTLHVLDETLTMKMMDFAEAHHSRTLKHALLSFADPEQNFALFFPWALYHVNAKGKTLAERYLAS